jgi:hypothetical protein
VAGKPGISKTRLLAEFVAAARAGGLTVLIQVGPALQDGVARVTASATHTSSWHLIMHCTHVRNLPGILEAGCLQAESLVDRGSLLVEAADLKIKADRKKIRITLAPHGCVADYVPFYYAPRSPMLF